MAETPREARKRIVAHLCAMHAISAEDAVLHNPQTPAEAVEFARLRAEGVIRDAAAGYHWIDLPAWRAHKLSREQRWVPIAIVAAVVIAAALMLFYRG